MQIIEPPAELAKVVRENTLPANIAQSMIEGYSPLFATAGELCREAESVKVTDATQVSEMKKSRELRLSLRRVRIDAEKVRRSLKDEALRTGKAIDGAYKALEAAIDPVESRLEQQEKFAEIAEAKRKADLVVVRTAQLRTFGVDDATAGVFNLGDMNEQQFAALLANTKAGYEAKVAAEAKAKADAEEATRKRAEEEARIREENRRLAQEAAEKEAELKKQREAAEAQRREAEAKAKADAAKAQEALNAERERSRKEREAAEAKARKEREAAEEQARIERMKAEKERREAEAVLADARKREAEARAELDRKQREEAAKQEAERQRIARENSAPEIERIKAYAEKVRAFEHPALSDEYAFIVAKVRDVFERAATFIDQNAKPKDKSADLFGGDK